MQDNSPMQCTKFVAQLHVLSESEGQITSFTSHARVIFIGTTLGNILAYSISVKPSSEKQIYTKLTLKKTLIDKKKITRLVHSPCSDVLFALSGKKVYLINSKTLDVIRILLEAVSDFSVSYGGQQGPRAGLHTITCAMHNKKEVLVMELDSVKLSEARRSTLILPEPVQQVVEHNGIVCLGMRREYSMLSVRDGDSKSLLALTGNAAPMLALGGSDVFMRLGETVFVVSMKQMPSTGNVLKTTIRFPEEPRSLVYAHPFLFGFCKSYCNVYSWYDGDIVEELPMEDCSFASMDAVDGTIYCASKNRFWLIRIVPLEHQLEHLVMKNKIDFAFDLLRSQPSQSSVPSPERLNGGAGGGGGGSPTAPIRNTYILEANLNVMVGFAHLYSNAPSEAVGHFGSFVDVREPLIHLPDLVPTRRSRAQVESRLRSSHASLKKTRTSTTVRSTANATSDDSSCPFSWCVSSGADRGRMELLSLTCHEDDDANDFEKVFWAGFRPRHPHSRLWELYYPDSSSQDSTPVSPSPESQYGGFPTRRELGRSVSAASTKEVLSAAWASSYYKYGLPMGIGDARRAFDVQAIFTASAPILSSRANAVALTLEEYLELAEDRLKEELVRWLSSRLETAPPTQRRAAEFALVVLYLQANDRRSLFSLVSHCEFLQFADLWEVLSSPLVRVVGPQGDSYLTEDLVMEPFEKVQMFAKNQYYDVLSRAMGFQVSAGEWRLLYLLLHRQLGFPSCRYTALGEHDQQPPLSISYFFTKYLSLRGVSELTLKILSGVEKFSPKKRFASGFAADFSEQFFDCHTIVDRHRVLSCGEAGHSMATHKGRQWPLLLRDYVEACRALYVHSSFPHGEKGHQSSSASIYPQSMVLPLKSLPALIRGHDGFGSFGDTAALIAGDMTAKALFSVRRYTTHELFFALEAGDYRFVGEALNRQQIEHKDYLKGEVSSVKQSASLGATTSCLFTVDDEGNNAFHILFLMLLRSSAQALKAGQEADDVSDDGESEGSDNDTNTQEGAAVEGRNGPSAPLPNQRELTADRRAKRMQMAASVVGVSDGTLDQSHVSEGLRCLYESSNKSGDALSSATLASTLSSDAALAILAVLLNHGCSEISVLEGSSNQTKMTHSSVTKEGEDGDEERSLASAFRESLGCALANPSSLLLLVVPNDHGVTPLQLVEAFPLTSPSSFGSSGHDKEYPLRLARDPNSHVFELVVSFILAQLRVFTVPE